MHLLVIIAIVAGVGALGALVADRVRQQPVPIPVRVRRPVRDEVDE